jgi:DNA-binding transcriptional regulator LsrR (DeoR family)
MHPDYSAAKRTNAYSPSGAHKMGRPIAKREEKLDLAARAAWLYYVAGNTQHEIAKKLQISRPVAQRLVALALEQGIVKVRVHHEITSCLEIAGKLRQKYHIVVCEVVPTNEDSPDQVLRKIAVAGAQVMEVYLRESQPRVIALSSGRTIRAVIEELTFLARPQHRVVSLVGAIAHDGSSNLYEVALRMAEKTGGKYFLLPAPLLADTSEERSQWCHHRLYRVLQSLSSQADVAFVGIGEIGIGCPLHRDGFIKREEVVELMDAGAVGETLGWAFNQAGEPIRTGIHERVTSIQLRRPSKKPVIGFAAGAQKAKAVLGALRGHWINGLVTDEACAWKILEND